jgi:hypothetical protein
MGKLEAIKARDAELQKRCDAARLPVDEANVSQASLDRRWLLGVVEKVKQLHVEYEADGCLTGDCPHVTGDLCDESLRTAHEQLLRDLAAIFDEKVAEGADQ